MGMKEEIRNYWNLRAYTFDSSPSHVSLPEVWREILSDVFRDKLKILDVGTGTGFIALRLAELGHKVVGVDFSKNMLKIAEKKAEKAGLKIEFIQGDAEKLPFRDGSFDAVICRHLLWTLPNPQKAVAEWSRIVREGGKVVVIEGRWENRSKIRSMLRDIAVLLHERHNPWKIERYRKEIIKYLPLYGGSSSERIVELFENAGLSRISVRDLRWIRELQRMSLPPLYRIAWNNREYFLIEGYKEVKK